MIIRVEERNGSNLIFSLAGRRGQTVKEGNATLNEDEVYQAIVKTADEYGFDVADFAFYADEPGLTILLELTDLTEQSGVLRHRATETVADSLDTFLRQENADYSARCKIFWNMPQAHLLYRDLRRYREQAAPYQIEPAHFLNTPRKINFFTKNIWQAD
ncbi:MAG: hypothetical protein IKO05_01450 [Selenomonadaceae bacterium]|nr:hypothetical protein [Selenomonadaceae bacterium]